MTVFPNELPQGRGGYRDWSGEISPMRTAERAPSDTGLGGVMRDTDAADGGANTAGLTRAGSTAERWNAGSMTGGANTGNTAGSMNAGNTATGWNAGNAAGNGGGMVETAGAGNWQGSAAVPDSGNMWESVGQGFSGPGSMAQIGQDIENNLTGQEIGAPDSLEEVFQGSMKALLLRNIGNYVVATFLIGTQGTVSWEGILYDVGNDYVAIYQTGRDQYIVSDLYSLKYVEFYDVRQRERCEALLAEQGE